MKYLRRILNLANSDQGDKYYFASGILVKKLSYTSYKQARNEVKMLARLRERLASQIPGASIVLPLACAYDLYGQSYMCYSYPSIEFS